MMPSATTIPVALGPRSYDILIGAGLLDEAGGLIARLRPGARAAIVTDKTVAGFHLPRLEASLSAAGIRHDALAIEPGEASKRFEIFADLCDRVLETRIERGDFVVALGGGVVGDLAGFVAAVVRRGVGLVQIPTTLLAQVDSSVGGKTGINSRHGKNLIGTFHQPSLVIADPAVLDTLPARDFKAGYAEVVKYGLINDAAFFAWLETNWRQVVSGGAAREQAIATSCRAKATIVARDETETGERALLNLGHTFGHALEVLTDYDSSRLVHGEGVAIGMTLAHEFSARLGLCRDEDVKRVRAHLRDVGLPTGISDLKGLDMSADAILAAMAQDKKVRQGRLTLILTRGIGQSFVAHDIETLLLRDFLIRSLERN